MVLEAPQDLLRVVSACPQDVSACPQDVVPISGTAGPPRQIDLYTE